MMIGTLPIRSEQIAASSSGSAEELKYMPRRKICTKVGHRSYLSGVIWINT
jgi:hypothetical protein